MAVTTENSTQYANTVATPPVKNAVADAGGQLKSFFFSHTQVASGDAGSLVNLCKLPSGRYRILLAQSLISVSALGVSRTLDVGHTGYTNADGTAVTAGGNAFVSAVDASGATVTAFTEAGTTAVPTFLVDSTTEVVLQAKVSGGTIDIGKTFTGYVVVCYA